MWIRAFLVVLGVVVGGCGGESVDVDLPPLTVEQYCAQVVPAACPALVACGVHVDLASCVDRLRDTGCGPEPARVAEGRVMFDGEAALDCVLERQADTSCPVGRLWPEACERVFTGTVSDGESCVDTADCGDDSYCAGLDVQCPGRCAARKPLGAAATGYDECADGLYEYEDICQRPVARGKSCSPTDGTIIQRRCESGFGCDQTDICLPWRGPGERCGPGVGICDRSDCIGGRCQRARRPGEACDLFGMVHGQCAEGLDCDGPRYEETFCVVPPAAGEPCSRGTCGEGLRCQSEMCVPLAMAGQRCDEVYEPCAWDLFCNDDRVCEELPPQPDGCVPSPPPSP